MLTINPKIQGIFTLSKINASTGEVTPVTKFNNLIVNNGLDLLFTSTAFTEYCDIGTGTAAPLVTDTSLTQYKYSTSANTFTNGNYQGIYNWLKSFYRFSPNKAGTYTEIGIGIDTNNLFSKSLIKDPQGNPMSITLLADEYLDVVYEVRAYLNSNFTATVNNFNLGKSIHTLNIKAAETTLAESPRTYTYLTYPYWFQMYLYTGSVGNITGSPSGSQFGSDTVTAHPYVTGSYTRTFTANFGLSNFVNNAQCTAAIFYFGFYGSFQVAIDPPIVKTNTEIMNLTYQISIGRYNGAG